MRFPKRFGATLRRCLILILLWPVPVLGQVPTVTLSLDALLSEARDDNPSLIAMRLEAEALAQRRAVEATMPDPTLSVVYQPYAVLTARGAQRSQWRVEQAIPFPGTLGLRGDIATLASDVARFEAETLEHDLALRIKERYFDLYRIQEQLGLLDRFRQRLRSFEEAAATRYEVAAGGQQAILKAQIERNDLSRRRLALSVLQRSALESLERLVDRRIWSDTLRFVVSAPDPPGDLDHRSSVVAALAHRPERRALNAATERAGRKVALERRAFYPDLGVSLTYFDIAASDVIPSASGRDALAIGASVRIPLQRRRLNAKLEEAQIRREQLAVREQELEIAIETEVHDLHARRVLQYEQLLLIENVLIPQAETALEATVAAYTTGRTTFLDLLDAERMLFSLENSRIEALTDYLKIYARFARALGGPEALSAQH